MGQIPPVDLGELASRASSRGGGNGSSDSGGGGGGFGRYRGGGAGATATNGKSSTTGEDARMRVRYDAHLPTLSLGEGENSRSILAGTVLLTLHGDVLCKNCHLCGSCWEDCKWKRSHVPTPPEVVKTVAGLLKASRGEQHACLQPSGCRQTSPRKIQSDLALTSTGKCSRLSGWTAKRQKHKVLNYFSTLILEYLLV